MKIPDKRIALLALLISASAAATGGASGVCYLPTEQQVSYSQVLALPTSSPDKIISYGPGQLQFGELWLPADGSHQSVASKHPLVVLVHGGCWLNAYDISHTHALSSALAQAGYAVWAIEYRRTGDAGGGWPGSYRDVKAAIGFTTELREYPVNLDGIVLAGHSAGGHLALLAGSDPEMNATIAIKSVVGLAAIVDLAEYALGENDCQTAAPEFMGGTPKDLPALYAAANPANRQLHANTLLIQGTLDAIVPAAQAQGRGVASRFIDGAGHFDMIHPGTASFQALLQHLARTFE